MLSPRRNTLASLLLAACASGAAAASPAAHYKYCIVGAGPGGVQLGQYMLNAGDDYALFERAAGPGHFFEKFPRHRHLISLNKRNTGRDNPSFNLRHDWNSLLGNEAVSPVTNRTTARFPHADVLVDYIRDFAKAQEEAGKIFYETLIQNVARKEDGQFELTTMGLSGGVPGAAGTPTGVVGSVECKFVVMTHGLWSPNVPEGFEGIEHAVGYEDITSDGSNFEGKSIAVLGLGNSAFEVANSAADYANFVHIWPTRDYAWKWPHTSWESRYVGSLRAIRTGQLDGYLLKSLDGLPLGNQVVASPKRMMIHECFGDKKCLFHLHPPRPDMFLLSFLNAADKQQVADVEKLREFGLDVEIAPLPQGHQHAHVNTIDRKTQGSEVSEAALNLPGNAVLCPRKNLRDNPAGIQAAMEWRNRTGDQLSQGYDVVVRAMGWHHNLSLYAEGAKPLLQSQKKYPLTNHKYESINVPGMFFGGTLAHGKEWKRAAGGFIHGFRYTARALHKMFSLEHEGRPWPAKVFDLKTQQHEIFSETIARINEASGPYQMSYTLGDAIVMDKDASGAWKASYLEEMPMEYLTAEYSDKPRFFFCFGFDGQHRTLAESIKSGTGFEPWVFYYPPNTDPKVIHLKKEMFRMHEDLHTNWASEFFGYTMKAWMAQKIEEVLTGEPQPYDKHGLASQSENRPREVADAKFLSIDMTIVNHYPEPVSLKGDDGSVVTLEPNGGSSGRLVSWDSAKWVVSSTINGRKKKLKEWVMEFGQGIYQEFHIGLEAAGGSSSPTGASPPSPTLTKESLNEMRAKDLKQLLTDRGMETNGRKAQLVARLLAGK